MSIARSLKKFESIGAIKIIHGGFDPETGQRRANQYLLIPPNQNKNETHQVAPGAPGQVTPVIPGQVTNPGNKNDTFQVTEPGNTRVTIRGEVRGEVEEVNIRKREDLNVALKGSEERGCPRKEGTQVLPSPDPFTSPSNGPNGGPPGVYVGFASPLMERLEAYERRIRKTLPRDKSGGWWLTPDQLAAVEEGS